MLPQIKILEREGLIVKEDQRFRLTDSGQIVAYHLEQFDRTLSVIDQQKKYWKEHDIGGLPQEFFLRLGELKKARINEAGTEEILKPHAQSLDMIMKSKKVSGISPVVHPVYPELFRTLAQDGREVSLIFSKNAYTKTKKDYYHLLLGGLQYENAHLSVFEDDMRFSTIVTESNLSMELFTKTGLFDSKQDLVSGDPMALKWGEDIFSYFFDRSHPVKKDGQY